MFKHIPATALALALAATSAYAAEDTAQTKPSDPPAATAPSTTTTPATPAPSASPSATTPSTSATHDSSASLSAPTMTDDEARNWVNKTVYSSDGKNVGEVAEILRDNTGKVTELHADVGGFLGLGETRVKVMPDQFKLSADRVILNVPGDQAKSLPHLEK